MHQGIRRDPVNNAYFRNTAFVIACTWVTLQLAFAGYFFVLYLGAEHDFAGIGAIVAYFFGGISLTAFSIMGLTLNIGLRQGDEINSLLSRVGFRGLIILLTSWVTWIAAFLGLSTLADVSYEFAKLCDGPIAFLAILILQILLYWKLFQWLTRALSNASKQGDEGNDAESGALGG